MNLLLGLQSACVYNLYDYCFSDLFILFIFPKLLRTPLSSPAMCNWEPVFSPGLEAVIKDMEMLPDHCVFTCRTSQGGLQLQTFPLKTPDDVAIHHVRIVI